MNVEGLVKILTSAVVETFLRSHGVYYEVEANRGN